MRAEDTRNLTGLEHVQEGIVMCVEKDEGLVPLKKEVLEAVKGGFITINEEIIEAVKCTECGKLHRLDEETYLTFIGNLHVGSGGGLLGNGNWDGVGVPVSYWCVNKGCLSDFLLEKEQDIKQRNIVKIINDSNETV